VRALLISDVYFPRVNGVSTSIQTFRRDLEALGCATWLVAPAYPEAWHDDPNVLRQPSRYLVFDPEDRLMIGRAAERACAALRGQVDVVHIHTPFMAHRIGIKAARGLGLPTVETYHTFFEEYFHHYLPLLPRWSLRGIARSISRRQCNAVDAVIAPSAQLASVLSDYGVVAPIEVIPTGLDLADFQGGDGAAFRARFEIPETRPVMLLVGRAAHEKNIGFIVDVVGEVRKTVPDVLLVLAGEGPALPGLKRKVAEAGLGQNVLFVGYLDRRSALRDCYRAANVFVFASRTETQGLVLLEALALGVPVVSTAVLGTKEVLRDARGAIVVDEDRDEFARAVTEVLRRPERQRALAVEAREFVATHWSSVEMARRLIALYERVATAMDGRSAANARAGSRLA
jgi:1,2-diacylglycerol 3-alpha-glucosyltransferase